MQVTGIYSVDGIYSVKKVADNRVVTLFTFDTAEVIPKRVLVASTHPSSLPGLHLYPDTFYVFYAAAHQLRFLLASENLLTLYQFLFLSCFQHLRNFSSLISYDALINLLKNS